MLRAIDKLDRLGPDAVRLLLGKGRKDESGDFTKGADLSAKQTDIVMGFVEAGAATRREVLENLRALVGAKRGGHGRA